MKTAKEGTNTVSKTEPASTYYNPEGPDVYSGSTWTVPDVDTFRNEILAESMIYHIGHLVEDCESSPRSASKQLREIRKIAMEESVKGRVVLVQKKIRAGSLMPEKSKAKRSKSKVSYKKSELKRSKTKPIFEYHSHPVRNTG